jgi:hypothetical protein
MKNGAVRGLFFMPKKGVFRFAKKTHVVLVFLTFARSCCCLCSCACVANGRVRHGRTNRLLPGPRFHRWAFTTFVGLHNRTEIGLETCTLYINLGKVFDTVLRQALFAILRRFGLPDRFVNIVIRFHDCALINVNIGKDHSEMQSSIGVRLGSCDRSILF